MAASAGCVVTDATDVRLRLYPDSLGALDQAIYGCKHPGIGAQKIRGQRVPIAGQGSHHDVHLA